MSRKMCFQYDIAYDNKPLFILCHVVYATLGFREHATQAVFNGDKDAAVEAVVRMSR